VSPSQAQVKASGHCCRRQGSGHPTVPQDGCSRRPRQSSWLRRSSLGPRPLGRRLSPPVAQGIHDATPPLRTCIKTRVLRALPPPSPRLRRRHRRRRRRHCLSRTRLFPSRSCRRSFGQGCGTCRHLLPTTPRETSRRRRTRSSWHRCR